MNIEQLFVLKTDLLKFEDSMNLQEQIAQQRSRLHPCDTTITLPSGQVIREIHTASGSISSVIVGSTTGFVVDNKPDLQVAKIIPGLTIGSQDVVLTSGLLHAHSISHVLSLGVIQELHVDGIKHLFVPLLDLPECNLSDVINNCISFIDCARKEEGCVFVHCNAGVSRSAAIVIAYLIKEGWSFKNAYDMVKSKRPVIKPNEGFVKFLKEMESRKRFQVQN